LNASVRLAISAFMPRSPDMPETTTSARAESAIAPPLGYTRSVNTGGFNA